MFGFDGEYRRRPVQSLGGASHTCDRDTVIRKAAQERQKRNELRQKENGAVVLQSYARSFIHRQRRKRAEREAFDAFLLARKNSITEDESLTFLLRRLNFFYSSREAKDGERLVSALWELKVFPSKPRSLYLSLPRSRCASKSCDSRVACCCTLRRIPCGC